MNWVQQKFWQDTTTYLIRNKNGVVIDNLDIKGVLRYCISENMLDSLRFLIGEFSEIKELYKQIIEEI
jgi:hypothetical protein